MFGAKGGFSPRDYAQAVYYQGVISDAEERLGKPEAVMLDIKAIRQAFVNTWSQIGSDLEHSAESGHWELTNIIAVEACMDADNLTTNCGCGEYHGTGKRTRPRGGECEGAVADELIMQAVIHFGYEPVLQFIAKHIHLV
jgi:hypothetical protein